MEQDEREVPGLPEGRKEEQGGDAPVPGGVARAQGGLACGAASSEQEGVSGPDNACYHGAAGRGDAPGSGRNEDPATICFEFRGFPPSRRAIAHATPPSCFRRLPLRSRKQYNPTRFIVAGDAASGITGAHDPGVSEVASGPPPSASLGSETATSRYAGVSAMANGGHGAQNEAMGSTAKLSEIEVAVDSYDRNSGTESKDVEAAQTSLSRRHPSHKRKKRCPDRFASDSEEEAGGAARAKARRGNTVLDSFLTYLLRTTPEQRPEWVRNVTADDVGVEGQRGIDDSATAAGRGPQEPPDEGARILAIVAILGASLALSLVSCVLFYIVGQRTASGLPDTHQKK